MEPVFKDAVSRGGLVWMPEHGWGYVDPRRVDFEYDDSYFQFYVGLRDTKMGVLLTDARLELVNRYTMGEVVDVGVGSGAFVLARLAKQWATLGFDVNEAGVEWLKERSLFIDLYEHPIESATFWDSLEHIHEPQKLLGNIAKFAFMSMPIYRDVEHLMQSKHFKKGEHIYYFTSDGLVAWMQKYGFKLVEKNSIESDLGREDIGSFVFKREGS